MKSRALFASLVAAAAFALLFPGASFAQWVPGGTGVCTVPEVQGNARIAPDGSGGMFLVWQDRRNGVHYDLFVQRLNAAGNALFTSNGLAVCNATGDQQWPVIVPDASGGAFIIWWDQRGDPSYPDLYAQHINSIGFGTWTPNGVAVCTDVSFAVTSFDIAPDGSGGAIAVWSDERNGASNADVFAQRVDASGSALWTPNGRSVCVATADQQRTRVVTDGSGGAILVWDDQRDGNYDIYAQRVNASGSALWTADGVPLYANTNNQVDARLIPDGSGGAIAVWDDGRSGLTFDIYAQRVDASGASLWTAGGVAVCTGSSAAQTYSQIVPDGAGGALIAWQDARSVTTWDAYAQRLDAAGNVLWTTNGVPVSIGAGHQENVAVVSDSSGGAIVAWQDTRPGFYDVYAQRVDASGSALWAANGVAVSNVVANKRTPVILSDNSGGAFLAWADWRTGGNSADIYAQRIDRAGRWVFASPPQISALRDIPNDQGGAILLQWARSELDALPDALITHYSAWRRLPQLAAGPVAAGAPLVDPIDIPADFSGPAVRAASGYSWQWLGNVPAQYFDSYALTVPSLYDSTGSNPGWQYFMVTAHAGSPAPFCDSAIDSGYSVDNLSPAAPQGLAGSPESSSEGLRLTWNASLESDREHYAVYRGPSPAFVPSPASLVASPRDTTWFDALWRGDSRYTYKVSCIDRQGNEGGFAVLEPQDVSGQDRPRMRNALAQNVPNPFNPATRIAFSVREGTEVSLRVYDASGRLVRVLASGFHTAGRYERIWDGRDHRGNRAASGVYFYRLDTADFTSTRKMVMIR